MPFLLIFYNVPLLSSTTCFFFLSSTSCHFFSSCSSCPFAFSLRMSPTCHSSHVLLLSLSRIFHVTIHLFQCFCCHLSNTCLIEDCVTLSYPSLVTQTCLTYHAKHFFCHLPRASPVTCFSFHLPRASPITCFFCHLPCASPPSTYFSCHLPRASSRVYLVIFHVHLCDK